MPFTFGRCASGSPPPVGSVALLALAAGACSSSSSSTTPTDAGADDGASAVTVDPLANWSCLGKVVEANAPAAPTDFAFTAVDPFTAKGLPGATVKTCAATDTACASPFETLTSDSEGKVLFKSLPTPGKGFEGFFQVQIDADLPNLNFEGHPITANYGSNYGRTHYGEAQLATLLQTSDTKVTFDRSRGIIGFQAHDCSQYPGGGLVPRQGLQPRRRRLQHRHPGSRSRHRLRRERRRQGGALDEDDQHERADRARRLRQRSARTGHDHGEGRRDRSDHRHAQDVLARRRDQRDGRTAAVERYFPRRRESVFADALMSAG